ncbi:Calsequestrin, skeletal muscle isoform precursor, partial [Reticulomyxa filosa]
FVCLFESTQFFTFAKKKRKIQEIDIVPWVPFRNHRLSNVTILLRFLFDHSSKFRSTLTNIRLVTSIPNFNALKHLHRISLFWKLRQVMDACRGSTSSTDSNSNSLKVNTSNKDKPLTVQLKLFLHLNTPPNEAIRKKWELFLTFVYRTVWQRGYPIEFVLHIRYRHEGAQQQAKAKTETKAKTTEMKTEAEVKDNVKKDTSISKTKYSTSSSDSCSTDSIEERKKHKQGQEEQKQGSKKSEKMEHEPREVRERRRMFNNYYRFISQEDTLSFVQFLQLTYKNLTQHCHQSCPFSVISIPSDPALFDIVTAQKNAPTTFDRDDSALLSLAESDYSSDMTGDDTTDEYDDYDDDEEEPEDDDDDIDSENE